jgi:hypothetical protein
MQSVFANQNAPHPPSTKVPINMLALSSLPGVLVDEVVDCWLDDVLAGLPIEKSSIL